MTNNMPQQCDVLVVDDNEVNRTLLEMRLQMNGYTVTSVDSGLEALQLCKDRVFNILLLDIMMPQVSGLDVLRQLRKHKSRDELPIIMTTALDQSADIVEALSTGANDYVTKPIDFPVLLARMESHLQLSRLSRQKDLFLTIASHDLKNPLAVIRGYASLLQLILNDELLNRDDARKMTSQIYRQTHTMEGIVSNYLDFQALQDGRLKIHAVPGELNALATKVVELLRPLAEEKKISLQTGLTNTLPQVSMDHEKLQQVCENLVGNAIKFSPAESPVTVRTHTSGSRVRFEVEDAGPGIPAGEQPQLFSMYCKLSNRPTGGEKSSGLGLAISRHLVQLHGGEIGMHNNPDANGSTFWFELPAL